MKDIKKNFFKNIKPELITNRKNIESYLYKTEENQTIYYHYFLLKKYEVLINRCLQNEKSFFLLWDTKNTEFIDKGIIIYTIEKKGEKTLKEFITNYHNSLIKSSLYVKDRILKQKNTEDICRQIMIKLFEILKNLNNDENYFVSLYNINTILIKEEENKEKNISIILNQFEMALSLHTKYFLSGTKISQAPQKIKYINMNTENGTKLKLFGNIANYILTGEFGKNNIQTIPIIASQECKNFLRTCFLNLKSFDNLNQLDFLNKNKSSDSFSFPKLDDLKDNSYIISSLFDEKPKNMNSPDELSLSNDYKYKVLELNSFCIKPEKEEEKINIKNELEKAQNNQINKINLNEESISENEMRSLWLFNPYLEQEISEECSIDEIFEKILKHRENTKQEEIKKYLDKIPIYTYPVPPNN